MRTPCLRTLWIWGPVDTGARSLGNRRCSYERLDANAVGYGRQDVNAVGAGAVGEAAVGALEAIVGVGTEA